MSEPRGTPLTLPPIYRRALLWLANQDHHSNMSAAARKAISQVMNEQLGRDWKEKVEEESSHRDEVAA
jgi:hypothetical protein